MKQSAAFPGFESILSKPRGPQQLSIRGGEVDDEPQAIQALLDAWRLPNDDTPWILAEWVHDMALLSSPSWSVHPDRDSWHLLERLRIFGPGGDFELRRDEARLHWRWIGPAPDTGQSKPLPGDDYWDTEHTEFICVDIKHLLWGKLDPDRGVWIDDRVARVPLDYPITADSKEAGRVTIRGLQFIAQGAPQFVWWQDIEGVPT